MLLEIDPFAEAMAQLRREYEAVRRNWLRFRVPGGWRIVHADPVRDVYTLERKRRFFKGRYRVATAEQLVNEEEWA